MPSAHQCLTSNALCLSAGTWPADVSMCSRGDTACHLQLQRVLRQALHWAEAVAILRYWLGILYLKVCSLILVCVLRQGRGWCNVILLLAWLEKYMMLSETVGVRAGLADVTVLLSWSDSWQPREPTTKPGICWNACVMACAEEKGAEVEVTELVVQCFRFFYKRQV